MSQLSTRHHRREQWKHKATQRGKGERNERRAKARLKAARDQSPQARFIPIHPFFTWADRVLQLSPPGGAKRGSILATLRGARDALPDCKALRTRFPSAADVLMACQAMLKTRGLAAAPVAPWAALIETMPTVASGQAFRAYAAHQGGTATT